jgi:hypothetical protein
MIDRQAIRLRWDADGSKRDERGRRLFAASEVRAAGWGGLAAVSAVTGLARSTIERGLGDLDAVPLAPGQVRREGGGPRPLIERDATVLNDLKRLVEPATMGDPVRPLLWVSKSREKLAAGLVAMGHAISPNSVAKLLVEELKYSRQANRKTLEGASHPDRNAQFEHINAAVLAAQAAGQPVISVDTKKKELIGNYRNGGTDYRPKGEPLRVKGHDFEGDGGKGLPYGVYDSTANNAWVSVGITHDTAEFAVASIRCWLERMGRPRYTTMRELMVTADCGGSNNARSRLWKVELQKFADEIGMPIKVCHYPPGTSKWNKIEHRLFCHITQNWRAKPLTSRAAVVELIASTTTKTGLKVECALDTRHYAKGIKVSNAEMKRLDIRGDKFHPEWNYTVYPRLPKS